MRLVVVYILRRLEAGLAPTTGFVLAEQNRPGRLGGPGKSANVQCACARSGLEFLGAVMSTKHKFSVKCLITQFSNTRYRFAKRLAKCPCICWRVSRGQHDNGSNVVRVQPSLGRHRVAGRTTRSHQLPNCRLSHNRPDASGGHPEKTSRNLRQPLYPTHSQE